jgi:hypothetical protein
MRLTTSKIITIIIGCMVAACIGALAPQCVSPKFKKGVLTIEAPDVRGDVAMANVSTVDMGSK